MAGDSMSMGKGEGDEAELLGNAELDDASTSPDDACASDDAAALDSVGRAKLVVPARAA